MSTSVRRGAIQRSSSVGAGIQPVLPHVVGLFTVDPFARTMESGNRQQAKSLTLIRRMKLATFFNSNVGFETAIVLRRACPKIVVTSRIGSTRSRSSERTAVTLEMEARLTSLPSLQL